MINELTTNNDNELILAEFKNLLCGQVNQEVMDLVSNAFILSLKDYEVHKTIKVDYQNDVTSEQIINMFLNTLLSEGKSKRTVEVYSLAYKLLIQDTNKHILNIGTFDIRIFLAKKQQTATLTTCENYRAYLSSLYTWLTIEGFLSQNPMSNIKPIKINKGIKTIFTDVEIERMRRCCNDNRERAILEIFISSGARVEEISDLNRQDINFANGEVKIHAGKGNKARKVYINNICMEYLNKYLTEDRSDNLEYLFVSRYGKRLSTRAIENSLKKLGKRANVEKVHPHKFRRTFATTMYEKGMNVITISKLLGHANINTTLEYIVLEDKTAKISYDKYSTF